MIRSFKHKGLQQLFEMGTTRGINPQWRTRLVIRLGALDAAQSIEEIDLPGFRLHELKGERAGEWALNVTGNYRMVFRPTINENEDESFDVWDVDLEDYH